MEGEGQSNFKNEIQETIRDSLLILIFEFLGTGLLAMLYMNCEQLMDTCGFFIGVYILIIFSAKISGSHFNPAITLAFMFRRDIGRFNRLLGIAYMIFQLGGAITGVLVSYIITGSLADLTIQDSQTFGALITEAVGAFILTFLYLSQTEQKTKISKDPGITTLVISAAYVAGTSISSIPTLGTGRTPLNPAIAFAQDFVNIFEGQSGGFADLWVYLSMPFAGAMVAVFFFEIIFKRV